MSLGWFCYIKRTTLWGRNLRGGKRTFSPLNPCPTPPPPRACWQPYLGDIHNLCYACICNDSYQTSKIFKILLSFLFSMEWYWMQGQLIPTCLCTSGRSVILSKVQHLWNRLEIVQSLMMKVSFGSSKFCPSLYSLKVSG